MLLFRICVFSHDIVHFAVEKYIYVNICKYILLVGGFFDSLHFNGLVISIVIHFRGLLLYIIML